MSEWTVHIEGAHTRADEDMAELLIDALSEYAPAVSYGNGRISVTMSVRADTPPQAASVAYNAFTQVVQGSVTRMEAELAA